MSNKTLTWQTFKFEGNRYSIGPTYYIEADYEPVAVRIYAEVAPEIQDAEFNIYDDGTTIFADRSSSTWYRDGGVQTQGTPITNIALTKGEKDEVFASDFNGTIIEGGSWVSCNYVTSGGGLNFTIQLDLVRLSEEDENEG